MRAEFYEPAIRHFPNLSFTQVSFGTDVVRNKENCRLCAVLFQNGKHVCIIVLVAVVECQRNAFFVIFCILVRKQIYIIMRVENVKSFGEAFRLYK